MSFVKFVIGFVSGLMGTMLLIVLFDNKFIISFFIGLAIGIVAAMMD